MAESKESKTSDLISRWLVGSILATTAAAILAGQGSAAAAAGRADEKSPWQVTEIGRLGDVTVRLRVMREASMADENWISIEFENRGTSPVELTNPHYRMEAKTYHLKSGQPSGFDNLASGNSYDMFPHAWDTTPVSPILVRPGVHRITEQPSFYSSALLGLPPKDGFLVKGTLFINVEVKGHGKLADSTKGHPFQFQWVYPDAGRFVEMRKRLIRLLANPKNKVEHAYIVQALQKIPEVAKAVSVKELLAATDSRHEAFTGREFIVEYLAKHHGNDPAVIRYYRDHLNSGDKSVLRDLRRAAEIWDPSFVEPLLRMYENDPRRCEDVVWIFAQQAKPSGPDPAVAQRLSAGVLKQARCFAKKPHEWNMDQRSMWAHKVRLLGLTRDPKLIVRLSPFLDDKTLIRKRGPVGLASLERLPPLRACDAALDAILTILDGNTHKAYAAVVEKPRLGGSNLMNEDSTAALRDKMIAELKKRLESRKAETPPDQQPPDTSDRRP